MLSDMKNIVIGQSLLISQLLKIKSWILRPGRNDQNSEEKQKDAVGSHRSGLLIYKNTKSP
jgi:hypothetical protein